MSWSKKRGCFLVSGAVISILIGYLIIYTKSMPRPYVGSMEANHPWIVMDPGMFQEMPKPYFDKSNSQIMYLIFFGRSGEAQRIDLKNKSISAYKFLADQGDPEKTIMYSEIENLTSKEGGARRLVIGQPSYERLPFWDEFRGQVEKRRVSHMFGYPLATESGTRVAELRTGYWYIMDKRGDRKVELLRVRIQNAENPGEDALGHLYISPDKRWVVFTLANLPARTFIFDREALTPEVFQ